MAIDYGHLIPDPKLILARKSRNKKRKKAPDVMKQGEELVLAHFGVKGMRWGVRRSDAELHGGGGSHEHPDHTTAKAAQAKIKKHGTKAVSNAELQAAINRMNLEQSYSRARAADKPAGRFKRGHEAVKQIVDVGGTALKIHGMVTNPATKAGAKVVLGAVNKARSR